MHSRSVTENSFCENKVQIEWLEDYNSDLWENHAASYKTNERGRRLIRGRFGWILNSDISDLKSDLNCSKHDGLQTSQIDTSEKMFIQNWLEISMLR